MALMAGTIILIIVALAVVRFLVHGLVRFVELAAVLVVVIFVLAWILARKIKQLSA